MKKLVNWKTLLIVGSTLAGLIAIYPPSKQLKLGIDLSGGTILVYEVAKDSQTANFNMDELIAALKQRADPQGVKETPIRKIGSNRIEIILPKASPEEVEEVKKMLTDVGSLEFRILANRKHDAEAVPRAMGPGGLAKPPTRYKWARLGEISTGADPQFTAESLTDPAQNWKRDLYAGADVLLTGKDSNGAEQTINVPISRNTPDTLFLSRPHELKSITSYTVEFNPSNIHGGDPANPQVSDPIIREEKVSAGRTEIYILCALDRQNVTGAYLSRTYSTSDQQMQPAVGFQFNRKGARRFGQLTREHLPEEGDAFKYQLAILLDNLVMSAPSINSEIRDSGIIEGGGQGFKAKEVTHLVNILQAGSLPASLNPTPLQEENVGPTLGEDSIAKGRRAILASMLIVPIFMIFYYRFAGVVAVVALVVNMILLVGSMAFIKATFSLPGLAGLALTIGMAVDANVLVFERMGKKGTRGDPRRADPQRLQPGLGHHLRLSRHQSAGRRRAVRGGDARGQGFRADHDPGHALEPVHGRVHVAGDLRDRLRPRLAQGAAFPQVPEQDQHRLRRPAVLLHGDFAGLDPAGPGRVLRPRQVDVQHRLHRRHPGHHPAQRGRPDRPGQVRVATGRVRPRAGRRTGRRHRRKPPDRRRRHGLPVQHPDDLPEWVAGQGQDR